MKKIPDTLKASIGKVLSIKEWKLNKEGKLDVTTEQRTRFSDMYGAELLERVEQSMKEDKPVNQFNAKHKIATMNDKKLALLCALLGVASLEMSDEGTFLNEEQLDKIEGELNRLQTQSAAADLAKADATKAKTTAEAGQKTAEDSLTAVVKALDDLDSTVKEAKDPAAKVEAVRTKLAAKPGANPSGVKKDNDAGADMNGGVDEVNAYAKQIF
jgi:hypothetical protein